MAALGIWVCLMPAVGQVAETSGHPEAGLPFVSTYPWTDYDASPENWTVTQDRRGVMYIGNNGGVLEHDGSSWRLLPLPNRTSVRALATDADDRIWVGGGNDFGFLEPDVHGRLRFASLLDRVPRDRRDFGAVYQVVATPGGVFFLTDFTLFRWHDDALHAWPLETEGFTIAAVGRTVYLMQLERGLLRVDGDALRLVPGGDRFAEAPVFTMLPFGDGRVLLGTREDGLWLFDPAGRGVDRFAPFPTEADALLAEGRIYLPGVALPGGRFAFGTRAAGLVVIDRAGRLVHHLDTTAGLASDDVSYVYLDRDGDLWLTHRRGLSRVEIDAPLSRFDAQSGLPVQALAVARYEGDLYAATIDGLYRLQRRARAFERVPGPTGLTRLLPPTEDGLLVAGSRTGLWLVDDTGRASRLPGGSENANSRLHRWRRDRDVVFQGHSRGLDVLVRTEGGWRLRGRVPGVEAAVTSIAEDAAGALWLGTDLGQVVRLVPGPSADAFEGATATTFGQDAGLPSGVISAFWIRGEVVATAIGGAVFRFDGALGRFVPDHRFGATRASHPLARFFLREDADGSVWVAPEFGQPMRMRLEPDGRTVDLSMSLGRLRDAQVYDVFPEGNGVAWLMGLEALVRYDARADAAGVSAPTAFFRRVDAGDRVLYDGSGPHVAVRVPPEARRVRFAYAAARYSGVRYRTRLDGLEDAWTAWSPASEREFSGLPPGRYTLRVQAESASGEPGPEAAYAFTMLPPWWRTWWASLGYVLLALGLGGVVYRNRQNRLRLQHRVEIDRIEAEQLRALDRARSEFFANVSHEFRTPLTLMLGPLDDVLGGTYGPVSEPVREPVGLARRSAQRVLGLIEQILAVSRLEAGATELRAQPMDLAAVARAHLGAFAPLAAHRGIASAFEAAGPTEGLWADAEHVGTILRNLLSNAFKFTPEGGRVRVGVEADGAEARVWVEDTGPGIPEADLARVFERFYQVAGDAHRPLGTGIGLALAHDLAVLHGGRLTAGSTPGAGSRFTLALPLGTAHLRPDQVAGSPAAMAAPAEVAAETEPGPRPEDEPEDDRTTVLVADDNADIRAYLRRHLEAAGYRVDEAEDGEAALARVRARLPDLVVSDVMMPRLDGLGLCRVLRADAETDFVPVLLLTARAAEEDRLDGLAEACDDYLTKPFDVRELVARVGNLIALRRRLRDRYAADRLDDSATAVHGDGASGDGAGAHAPGVLSPADARFLASVRAVIDAHLGDEAFTIDAIAEAIGLSRGHLNRRLSEIGAPTPSDLLRTARLEHAARLLREEAGTVGEVAYAVGYKSVAHFSNAFLAHTGMRPSAVAVEAARATDPPN